MKWFDSSAPRVLKSDLAGSWYPDNPGVLRSEISAFLSAAPPASLPGPISALILPHAGYRYSGVVAAAGIRLLEKNAFRRVVVLGPTHQFKLPDAAIVPDASHVRTVLGDIPLDTKQLERLRRTPGFFSDAHKSLGEHSVEIHLPMLQMALGEFELVPVIVGQLSEKGAKLLASGLRPMLDAKTLLIVSSDFTHYGLSFGYVPFTEDIPQKLKELDFGAFDLIQQKNPTGFRDYIRKTGATICGQDAIRVLLNLLGETQSVERLQYQTSVDVTGDDHESVSYLAAAVSGAWGHAGSEPAPEPSGLSAADRFALLRLARETIGLRLNPLSEISSDEPDRPALQRPSGAFVTLHYRGELRGCIGEIVARRPLIEAVAELAVSSAFEDPRFRPLTLEEWPEVTIEISVLTPPRAVDSWEEIEIGRHGVFLHKNGRSAVFLPQVATEQGWDVSTMLSHLARKAGLPPDAWKEGATFEVFEAEVFSEAEEKSNHE